MEPVKDTNVDKKMDTKMATPAPQTKVNETVRVMAEIDMYVSEIIKSGPQTPDEVQVVNYSPNNDRHRLALPESIEGKYGKKYAFRWVNKNKSWIDRAIYNRRWNIVNRTLFYDMPKHLFTANGTIENGDTILCFMPIAQAERLRRAPGELSAQRVKDLPMEQWKNKGEDSPFYKPDLTSSERDGEVLAAGIQPDLPTNSNE